MGEAHARRCSQRLAEVCSGVESQAPLGKGGARAASGGSGVRAQGPRFASQTLGFMGEAHEWRWPRRLASAPASTDTVAAFRPWRGFRSSVARGRRGHHRRCVCRDANHSNLAERGGCTRYIHVPRPPGGSAVHIGNPADASNRGGSHPLFTMSPDVGATVKPLLLSNLAERGGFEPPKRGLDAYTLSRRAPSTTRTPLRIA